jgi:hypothetical protein
MSQTRFCKKNYLDSGQIYNNATIEYRDYNTLNLVTSAGTSWLRTEFNYSVIDHFYTSGINCPVDWYFHSWSNIYSKGDYNDAHNHPPFAPVIKKYLAQQNLANHSNADPNNTIPYDACPRIIRIQLINIFMFTLKL